MKNKKFQRMKLTDGQLEKLAAYWGRDDSKNKPCYVPPSIPQIIKKVGNISLSQASSIRDEVLSRLACYPPLSDDCEEQSCIILVSHLEILDNYVNEIWAYGCLTPRAAGEYVSGATRMAQLYDVSICLDYDEMHKALHDRFETVPALIITPDNDDLTNRIDEEFSENFLSEYDWNNCSNELEKAKEETLGAGTGWNLYPPGSKQEDIQLKRKHDHYRALCRDLRVIQKPSGHDIEKDYREIIINSLKKLTNTRITSKLAESVTASKKSRISFDKLLGHIRACILCSHHTRNQFILNAINYPLYHVGDTTVLYT
jgi:hypothetical protein